MVLFTHAEDITWNINKHETSNNIDSVTQCLVNEAFLCVNNMVLAEIVNAH